MLIAVQEDVKYSADRLLHNTKQHNYTLIVGFSIKPYRNTGGGGVTHNYLILMCRLDNESTYITD